MWPFHRKSNNSGKKPPQETAEGSEQFDDPAKDDTASSEAESSENIEEILNVESSNASVLQKNIDGTYGAFIEKSLEAATADGFSPYSTAADDPAIQAMYSAALQQSVAMMGQDTQSFLQGMELIYTASNAKALEMIAGGDKASGIALLTQIQTSQTATTEFSAQIAATAALFAKL